MHPRLRGYAHAHWTALDAALTRALPPHEVATIRGTFTRAAERMSDTYGHLLEAAGRSGGVPDKDRQDAVAETVRELAAALSASWRSPTR